MSRDKQIEEMAKDVLIGYEECDKRTNCPGCLGDKMGDIPLCQAYVTATALYNAGYRKSTDVAEEIFAEIEKMLLDNHIGHYKTVKDTWSYNFNNEILSELAELKKKYIGKDTNVTTNTEET